MEHGYDIKKYVNWQTEYYRQRKSNPDILDELIASLTGDGGLSRVEAVRSLSGRRRFGAREFQILLRVLGLPKPWKREEADRPGG